MSSKRSLVNRRQLVQGTLVACLLLMPCSPGFAAEEAGHVARVKGMAEAITGAENRRLEQDAKVFVADTVRTGAESRVGLELGKHTTLNLGASTKIRIDKYLLNAGGTINLDEGTIMFEHEGPKKDKELEFRSPYGLIAVRGTRFYAGPSNGAFGVLVGTGRVVVTSGGKSVELGPQQGTDISAPGAAPSEPKKWGLARIRAMKAAVR